MSAKVVLDTKGIVLAPGELSRAPGALTIANNVNVEAPGVIRSRQGFAKQANGVGGPGWKFISTKELTTHLLVNWGTTSAATSLKYGDGSAAFTAITGTITNQPDTRMQASVSERNHYLTGDEGVRRLESDMTLHFAGMPKGLALDTVLPAPVLSGTGGFLADTESVAYRVTWSKKDVQGIPMEGTPSARTIVYNNTRTSGWATGVAKNVWCHLVIPKQHNTASTALTTAYYYRLYRSAVAAIGVPPSDEMNLVAEGYLTAGTLSLGYVAIEDTTPEAFRQLGEPLYTNETLGGDDGVGGPGLDQSNNPPPRSRDITLFAGCLFYSDLTYLATAEFTILSTVASTGLTAGDTITISGIVFTCIAPGTPGNNEFAVATVAAGSSATEALERTAQNLVQAINVSTTNIYTWAHYASVEGELPGKIRLEARTSVAGFTVVASAHGTAYRPSLATGLDSTNDIFANGYAFSKPAQGDAVPAVNVDFIGRDDTALLRMQVLRDAIYFFTDAGIYRLTGRSFDDFAVQEFDLSFRLRGRDMVCVCDDYIYAWGYEGIARISSAGVEYISNAIEPLVWASVKNAGQTWLATYGWAASYRSRHKVLFAIPTDGITLNCTQVLVYDTRMEAWTTWSFKPGDDVGRTEGHSAGAVRVSDDLLFLAQISPTGTSSVFKERLTYAAVDYQDDTYNTAGREIEKTVRWNASVESPELATHWDELHLFWDISSTFAPWTTPTALTVNFYSDMASASSAASLAPTATSRMSRCTVPRAQRRSARLSLMVQHSTVSEYFGLEGMALVHQPGEGTATVKT